MSLKAWVAATLSIFILRICGILHIIIIVIRMFSEELIFGISMLLEDILLPLPFTVTVSCCENFLLLHSSSFNALRREEGGGRQKVVKMRKKWHEANLNIIKP